MRAAAHARRLPRLRPAPCRRFSAGEGARLLAAWASLRRRQPFNPGEARGQPCRVRGTAAEPARRWARRRGAPARTIAAHPLTLPLASASHPPLPPGPDAYNFSDLSRHLVAGVGQLSGGELQMVAGAAPAFSWPVYASLPLLHAVCREAVHRWAGRARGGWRTRRPLAVRTWRSRRCLAAAVRLRRAACAPPATACSASRLP